MECCFPPENQSCLTSPPRPAPRNLAAVIACAATGDARPLPAPELNWSCTCRPDAAPAEVVARIGGDAQDRQGGDRFGSV
jgi:hypothetical protein